ncbi:hypothetical protein [Kocuria palustris]|uniref:hypothetical protein n=1 Tax=Kocuria palustris TaxID=71999 RepID=UPI0035E16E82
MNAQTPPAAAVADSVLSDPRMATYRAEAGTAEGAFALYCWNAQVSAKFMVPIHFAEVALRNVVNDVLSEVYGANWPWSQNLILSLPDPSRSAYSPRQDLARTASRYQTTGKIVAELKFAFWVSMFTRRHHQRLWKGRIFLYFPESPLSAEDDLRHEIRERLDEVRVLRNRIAHHEPVFKRDLMVDQERLTTLVKWRSLPIFQKVAEINEVPEVLANKPSYSN